MQEYASVERLERQAQPKAKPRLRTRMKIRYSNKTKVLMCYVITWTLALAIPLAGLVWVYPYKLVGTAPGVAENLAGALPFLAPALREPLAATALLEGMSPQATRLVLETRDLHWRAFVGGCFGALWLVSLLGQLVWRSLFRRPLGIARATRRAIRTYRFTLLILLALNALGGLLVYLLGIQFIGGRTFWDWLLYMNGFALNLLAAAVCCRIAAPPAISGKQAFFKRL